MTEGRDLRQELRVDALPGDEELERVDALREGRVEEVLALGCEEARLVSVLARREKLADEPQLLVLARGDQAAAWSPLPAAASAAFALSATTANASGSDTAISASDLRSSSIPASRTPAMKRL
jgi:hypothetical protein